MIHFKYIIILILGFFTLLHAYTLEERQIDCNAGDAEACYTAAETYATKAYKVKSYDLNKTSDTVITLYKKSCTLGYAKGCTAYATRYASDRQKDPQKSEEYYFQKACDGGDGTGCTLLNMMALRP